MLKEKLPKWLNPETAVICTIIGAFWWGHILCSDANKETKTELLDVVGKQSEQIKNLEVKIEGLENKIATLSLIGKAEVSEDQILAVLNKFSKQKEREAQQALIEKYGLAPEKTKEEWDHVYGNPEARFTIYEYSDFDCPFCKDFFIASKRMVESSNGNLNIIFREFPLAMHGESAQLKAMIAECVAKVGGNRPFWAVAEGLYKGEIDVDKISQKYGLDENEINSCLRSQTPIDGIMIGLAEGNKLGVTGTPGVIILDSENKVRHMFNGTPTEKDISIVIQQMIKTSKPK